MNTLRLLRYVSFSHIRVEWLRTLLTVTGMALGVAVYGAIRTANHNALESFSLSAKLLGGTADRSITSSSGGVKESLLPQLRGASCVAAVSPQSTRYLYAHDSHGRPKGLIQIIGVDLFGPSEFGLWGSEPPKLEGSFTDLLATPNATLASASLAAELGERSVVVTNNGGKIPLVVLGTLPNSGVANAFGGRVLIIDIAHYQQLFNEFGHVETFLVRFKPGCDATATESAVQQLLPPGTSIQRANGRARQAEKMSEAFQLNLNFLSCISLFVALLLIYNTISYAVLKRRSEFGILQAIGTSPRTIVRLVALEGLVTGAAASLLGIALAYLFSFYTVAMVAKTFSTLYVPVEVRTVRISLQVLLECLLLGPAIGILGSFLPSLEAKTSSIRESFGYQSFEEQFVRVVRPLGALGALLLVVAVVFARSELLRFHTLMGFVSPTALTFGMVLLTPWLLLKLLTISKRSFGLLLGIEILLAFDHLRMTLRRTSVATAAIMVALGMYLGVTVMILSFRNTVEIWIHQITKADLFISPLGSPSATKGVHYLPDEVASYLGALPEVRLIDWTSTKTMVIGEREVQVTGVRFSVVRDSGRLVFLYTPEELSQSGVVPVYVSETFANRFAAKRGTRFTVPGNREPIEVEVANVYYDYSSDQGVVLIDHDQFVRLDGETRKQGVSLYLQDSTQAAALKALIEARFPEALLFIRDNHTLRAEVLRVFDETFRITYALQAIALLISVLTILNTIAMLMLERKKEFGVMRAIGASGNALLKMVVVESLLIGGAALLGAVVLGFGLALLLVFVVNRFFFGWSVAFTFPLGTIAIIALLTIMVAGIAGLLPGYRYSRTIDAKALRYE